MFKKLRRAVARIFFQPKVQARKYPNGLDVGSVCNEKQELTKELEFDWNDSATTVCSIKETYYDPNVVVTFAGDQYNLSAKQPHEALTPPISEVFFKHLFLHSRFVERICGGKLPRDWRPRELTREERNNFLDILQKGDRNQGFLHLPLQKNARPYVVIEGDLLDDLEAFVRKARLIPERF